MNARGTTLQRLAAAIVAASAFGSAAADTLPVRRIGPEDGLSHPRVERIVSDSRDRLWFCTSDALSVYDGVTFRHFRADWLESEHEFHDVAEGADGTLWVGIWRGGIALLDPAAPANLGGLAPLEGDYPHSVRRLVFDDDGKLWIATNDGLFRIDDPARGLEADVVPVPVVATSLWDLELDTSGRLWIASSDEGASILAEDGSRIRLDVTPADPQPRALTITRARDGTMWVGHDRGLTHFTAAGSVLERYTRDQLGEDVVVDVFESRDGDLWISCFQRVLRYDGRDFEAIDIPAVHDYVRRFAQDSTGQLWLGTMTGGALAWPAGGLVSLLERDGLAFSRLARLQLDREGTVIATAGDAVYAYRNRRFDAIRPRALAGLDSGQIADNGVVLQDSRGGWWIGSRNGLFLHRPGPVDGLVSAAPVRVDAVVPQRDGRPMALYESADGAVWSGTSLGEIFRIDLEDPSRSTRIERENPSRQSVRAFEQSPSGDLWVVGFGGLARIDTERLRLEWMPDLDGQQPMDLLFDPSGALLVAALRGGVWISRDPAAEEPTFRPLPEAAGVAARCLELDPDGRAYVGTKNGLLRLASASEPTRRFSESDGVSNLEIWDSLRDSEGRLWFSSERGITRIDPGQVDRSATEAPSIWIEEVRIGGEPQPTPQLGARSVTGLIVPPGRISVEIDLSALSFDPSRPTRFQYRFEGTRSEWSAPSSTRTVTLAGLGAGLYTLAVRAVAGDVVSEEPATVGFRVAAPFWRRPWFLTLSSLIVLGVIGAVVANRVARMRELNEIRLRIATDLHDEIGSGLSQVSVLSELARRRSGEGDDTGAKPLRRIGEVSRELIDAMGDIVWAISPQRDTLDDLAKHMRRFASDALESGETRLLFDSGSCDKGRPVGPRLRRDLYLIFKECVHNVVKHADASTVSIRLRQQRSDLVLEVEDDGRGFDPTVPSTGHGRASLESRVAGLGGRLELESAPGGGTRIRVTVPYPTGWRRLRSMGGR